MDPASRRTPYPSDLTDAQWDRIDSILPARSDRGNPGLHSEREILCAINYRWTTGCVWRMLPHDFPPWLTVYRYFRRWQRRGLLAPIRQILISDSPESVRLYNPAEKIDSPADSKEFRLASQREAG